MEVGNEKPLGEDNNSMAERKKTLRSEDFKHNLV